MPPHNSYRPVTVTEPYDPKQRLIGAVVLFLIILFIYGILKLLLGMSDDKFLMPPKPETIIINEKLTENKSTSRTYSLPQQFVFLDLNGSPLQEEFYETEEEIEEIEVPEEIKVKAEKASLIAVKNSPELDICAINTDEKQWYVQAASFKTEQRAQHLAQKIKDAKIAPEGCIIKSSNGWYAVHLPPETDYRIVQYQHKRLYQLLHLKGLIRKLNGTLSNKKDFLKQ
jgi:cell division protein FtsN